MFKQRSAAFPIQLTLQAARTNRYQRSRQSPPQGPKITIPIIQLRNQAQSSWFSLGSQFIFHHSGTQRAEKLLWSANPAPWHSDTFRCSTRSWRPEDGGGWGENPTKEVNMKLIDPGPAAIGPEVKTWFGSYNYSHYSQQQEKPNRGALH